MHVTLFKALKSIKVSDEAASAVIDDIERHVESVVNNNIKAVQADLAAFRGEFKGELAAMRGEFNGELRGVAAGIEALRHQNILISLLISIVGLAVAVGTIVAKFIH